jgi:hypothetical protein
LSLSLHTIARGLGGRVQGNKVVAPGPEVATHKIKWKRKRKTLAVWFGHDGDIRVHSHSGQDPITTKDWVRRQCGLAAWEPKKRKPKPLPPLWERNQYLSESLRIARDRKRITFEQFALVINDLKNASPGANLKSRAAQYAREFGFTPAEMDTAVRQEWRSYTATERAGIFESTYGEYRRLGLRRSGCLELDPTARRRLTKQRYNAKKRAERAAKRVSKSAAQRAPLSPSKEVGTVRVPSSEGVVGLAVSKGREPERGCSEEENYERQKIGAAQKASPRTPGKLRRGRVEVAERTHTMSEEMNVDTVEDEEVIILRQIAAGELVYLAERDAAEREEPIFAEIHGLTVEVANSHAHPALEDALPRLENALRRLQKERAETHRDLSSTRAGCARARVELRSRGVFEQDIEG